MEIAGIQAVGMYCTGAPGRMSHPTKCRSKRIFPKPPLTPFNRRLFVNHEFNRGSDDFLEVARDV